MTPAKQIAKPHIPGWEVRAKLIDAGIVYERERIIKLLEEITVDEDGCFSERMPETLIALIKGENK